MGPKPRREYFVATLLRTISTRRNTLAHAAWADASAKLRLS
jgi:hypothetical protein